MDKYQNKYRISSARLKNWNYSWAGCYFITICTANREHYFGKMVDGIMQLSPTGVIADILWHEIINHAKDIDLGAFVTMPNHIHGILILNANNDDNNGVVVETGHALSLRQSTQQSTQQPLSPGQQRFRNQGKNTVSSIIGSYKSAVTKHAHRLGFSFAWQTRFHDHIIRNNEEYQRIENYIICNPNIWIEDKFYTS